MQTAPLRTRQAHSLANRSQPPVGIVVPQQQSELRPRGKHAVRLVDPLGHQVIHQHAEVRLAAIQNERLLAFDLESCIDSGQQALPGGLFVPGGSIDLPGKVQPRHALGFEGRVELGRRGEVVLHGVPIAHDLGPFEALDRADHLVLDIAGEAGRDAVAIELVSVAALGLQENLVRGLVGEPHHFVLDTRAIARPGRLNLPAVHRGSMQVRTNQLMHPVIRLGQPARHLRFSDGCGEERERHRIGVTRLFGELAEVDRPAIQSTRRPGLKPLQLKPQPPQVIRQRPRRPLSRSTTRCLRLAGVHDRLQERPRGDDHSSSAVESAASDADAGD